MKTRKFVFAVLTIILIGAVLAGAVSARPDAAVETRPQLANVRDYVATTGTTQYAVDGGRLFAGQPGAWVLVTTPERVIVSTVVVSTGVVNTGVVNTGVVNAQEADAIYIGAANELAIYRTLDAGRTWLRIPLTDQYVGGVTDIAVDGAQRLLFVGTDTAGLFRLRDVGSSVVVGGHLLLDAPVLEVAADSTGQGLAFARTEWKLYRAENFGLAWVEVDTLLSAPTALAIAETTPAQVYVGTVDRGLLVSADGRTWATANDGLNFVPGSRLMVDALAVDPAQPEVLYVATSYLYGSTTVHAAPNGVAMRTDSAQAWTPIYEAHNLAVAQLLPLSGVTGGVYALTSASRTPLALGNAPVIAEGAVAVAPVAQPAVSLTAVLAWVVAGLAALALVFAVAWDLRSRRPARVSPGRGTLAPSSARSHR